MTVEPVWPCGAFQRDLPPGTKPYRCTEPYDHPGDHLVEIDGRVVAQWRRLPRT
ncbi:hypothetical protein ACWER9_06570 [Micromonospora sp. NPDC003944]